MKGDQPPATGSLSLSLDQRVDEACERFERAWKGRQRPRIEDYLAEAPEPDRVPLFGELLALETELRRNGGERPAPEEYHRRFPEHIEQIDAVFANAPCDADGGPPGSSEGATGPHAPPKDGSAVDPGPPRPPGPPPAPEYIGRSKVVRRLGGGAYGDVYLAHDAVMDRQVAVKVPSARLLATERAREEFLREARGVARLQHEGIVRAYDFGEADGRCYIVYELVDGESLAERIKPGRLAADPLPPEEATRLVAQVAEALHHAHLQGLVHRDIKPANILLDRQGRPKVADFGVAVREEDLARERGRLAGTLSYMSPEQVRREGHHLDGRSDVYSLGVVLYELLCDRRPFTAGTQDDLIDQILHRQARPLRQVRDSIPRELERICLKALSKPVNDRYTTAGDMAEELRRVLTQAEAGRPQAQGPGGGGVRLPGLTFERTCKEPQGLVHRYVGPYLVREAIGSGGTGLVYRASNAHTGREACVKVLYPIPPSALGPVGNSISRWVRGLAALGHAKTATPLDFAPVHLEDGSSFYVATEFIRGEPLSSWNEKLPDGPAAVAARTRVALDMAEALQAAHTCTYIDEVGFECRGVLHGDVKPSNVIVRPDGSAVLIDFMMVDVNRLINPPRAVDRDGIPADVRTDLYGTPGFMAPEQERDGIVTVRSDIYSLGKTIAFLFFRGRVPPGAPPRFAGLVRLVGAMMQPDRSLRPPDMADVVRQLLAVDRDLNVTSPPTYSSPVPGGAGGSPHLDQNVQFSVYRPGVVRPRQWYTMLAFAHLSERPPDAGVDEPNPIEEVQRQARQALGEKLDEYRAGIQDSQHPVPRQGELTFVPEVPGVEFNPPSRSFVWEEAVHREEFRLRASPELDGQTARGRLTVFLGAIILAEVNLSIPVDNSHRTGSGIGPHEVERARPYRRIFASYSRKDSWVVDQFKKHAGALGDEYVQKHMPLRAGEEWSGKLERLIEEADIFQLFWSTNSMHSPFVRREWEYALSLRRPSLIRPCHWESPLPTCPEKNLPPEELRRVHFQRIPVASPRSTEAAAEHPTAEASAGEPEPELTATPAAGPEPRVGPDAGPPAELGQYRLDRSMGCGGLGSIYIGHNRSDPLRPLIIKVFPSSGRAGEPLLREYRLLARLRHPGIVKAVEAGVEGSDAYLVEEYVDGVSLQQWLEEYRPACEQAATIVAAVAEALDYAHANGVLHRDVKPSHILLTREGNPVLIGFGLSSSMLEEDVTAEGTLVGTPAYMSPEQTLGQRVDGRADIYSLGVVLYEMLCGKRPYANGPVWDLLRRVREEEPPSPRRVAPGIPRALENICLKAMAKQVNRRYASGAELAADLQRYLAGAPLSAGFPRARALAAPRWHARRPESASPGARPWAAVVLVALGISAILAGLLWLLYFH
jgi:serine/threonine protein kinase